MLTAVPAGSPLQLPADAPLLACTRFATSDPDEAVEEATKILAPHNMEVRGDVARFRARASHAQLRDASLIYMDYDRPLSFHCAPQHIYVAVVLPVSGQMAVAYEGGDVLEVPRG